MPVAVPPADGDVRPSLAQLVAALVALALADAAAATVGGEPSKAYREELQRLVDAEIQTAVVPDAAVLLEEGMRLWVARR